MGFNLQQHLKKYIDLLEILDIFFCNVPVQVLCQLTIG